MKTNQFNFPPEMLLVADYFKQEAQQQQIRGKNIDYVRQNLSPSSSGLLQINRSLKSLRETPQRPQELSFEEQELERKRERYKLKLPRIISKSLLH